MLSQSLHAVVAVYEQTHPAGSLRLCICLRVGRTFVVLFQFFNFLMTGFVHSYMRACRWSLSNLALAGTGQERVVARNEVLDSPPLLYGLGTKVKVEEVSPFVLPSISFI